ncbi:flagellar export protein FliJ [Heyndrickxia acidicola]|uniref:Flagellar FliJ protein n=1 Tax=Heyndrickxia acidicola TaxID=209389 RepID=A0ABU6MBM0_9BACI|nr:flagellar export protein FliJ [Heyndrickxia acidicola]MED1202073.1 flagellar export protein FliJ [Heyndrickxia acidicola]
MKFQFKLEKILALREREKEEAISNYQKSVKSFEEIALELYKLLKKKEDLMKFQEDQLMAGLAVQEIRHYQNFINNLELSINHLQELVVNARTRMNWFQQLLNEKNIEVKKYETMKEESLKQFLEQLKRAENKEMDEISTLQFIRQSVMR